MKATWARSWLLLYQNPFARSRTAIGKVYDETSDNAMSSSYNVVTVEKGIVRHHTSIVQDFRDRRQRCVLPHVTKPAPLSQNNNLLRQKTSDLFRYFPNFRYDLPYSLNLM